MIPTLMKEHDAPGLSVVFVDADRVLWVEGFGFADPEERIPVTPDTLFSLQSNSKALTATAMLIAVQDGLVSLDAPIKKYLPSFSVHSPFESNPEERITLRHLLSHTAGFTHEAPVGNNEPSMAPFDEHIRSISDTWLRHPVGQRFNYSNLGVDLAGYVLQVASRRPFEEYVKDKLLDPLGMHRSSFDMARVRAHTNRAIGYASEGEPWPLEIAMIPAGGCYTSATEIGRFIQFHLNGGKVNGRQVLDQALLREMYRIPFPAKGQLEGYGLGVNIMKSWSGGVVDVDLLDHGGSGFGFGCSMKWFPDKGIGAAALSRCRSGNNAAMIVVSNLVFQALMLRGDWPSASMPYGDLRTRRIEKTRLERLCGRYGGRGWKLTVAFEGDICGIRFNGGDFQPLRFVASNEAFTEGDGGVRRLYQFVLDDKGRPDRVIMLNNGQVWDYIDGPNDKLGPNKEEWRKYLGRYGWKWHGAEDSGSIHVQNGHLYFDDTKLREFEPGLFISSEGEVLDLRSVVPTWRSHKIKRVGQ
jgi:CubicO group peptidase (beta-lactamase class C family)